MLPEDSVDRLIKVNPNGVIGSELEKRIALGEHWNQAVCTDVYINGHPTPVGNWFALGQKEGPILVISNTKEVNLSWIEDFLSPTEEELFLMEGCTDAYLEAIMCFKTSEWRAF